MKSYKDFDNTHYINEVMNNHQMPDFKSRFQALVNKLSVRLQDLEGSITSEQIKEIDKLLYKNGMRIQLEYEESESAELPFKIDINEDSFINRYILIEL